MPIVSHIPANVPAELRACWRRRRLVLAVGWGVSVAGWLVVMMLPDRYDAMTRIYVDTDNLLTPLLRNITVQADVTKQIEVLQRTLLNRKNMASVAHSADLDLDLQTDQDKERLYTQLTKQITVKTEGNNLFSVTYSNSNPQMAKNIVEALLTIFVETNLGQNRSSMENARSFIDAEIANYERKLKQADERLADYKSHHVDVLAGEGNTTFSTRLDAARQELIAAKSKVGDLVAFQARLAANLATIPQYIDVDFPQQVFISAGAPAATSARGRVQQLEAELSQLQAQDTDAHPDVLAVKRSLERARQSEERETAQPANVGGRGRVANPLFEQVKLRLIQAEADVAQAQSRAKIDTDEVERLQGLTESAPRVEAELAELNRDSGVMKGKFEELLGRRESARISEAVENRGDKIQFRIIEAPQVPTLPSFPNRPLLFSGALALSLAIGAGVVLLLHKIDDTIGSAAEITEMYHVKVFGAVPRVESLAGMKKRRREGRNFAIGASGLLVAYLLVMAVGFAQQSFPGLLHIEVPSILLKIQSHVG